MLIKKARNFMLSVIMLLIICVMTGCMDLGAFESDEEYYKSFGSITLIDEAGASSTYSMEDDFYNAETVDKMKTSVESNYYVYFLLEIKRDMVIDEFAMYVKSEESVKAQFSFFILDAIPTTVPTYESTVPIYAETDPFYKEVQVAKSALNMNMWDAFNAKNIGKADETGKLMVKDGDILCVRFDNNTCFGKELNLKKYKMTLTNCAVRANY